MDVANARAASAGEEFCERAGFSQTACDAQDSEECRCAWDDGQCSYSEGARCPASDDDKDTTRDGAAFCENIKYSEAECKSYDSSECKCEWDNGQCWYNEGQCALQRPPMTYWKDDVDFSVFTRAAVCPLNAKGQLVLASAERRVALRRWRARKRGNSTQAIAFVAWDAERSDVKLNGRGYQLNANDWSCSGSNPQGPGGTDSAKWAHAEVFDTLSESSSTAPVAIELDYYKCKMDLREVVEEALGISVGNAALVYILTSVICVHALVRALGKCGAVRFRNGRFISPVVLDEYLERKSVDAVLRERETDPFL